MTNSQEPITFWRRLTPAQAHEDFYIPEPLAYAERSRLFTDCDREMPPAHTACQLVGLFPDETDGEMATVCFGGFSVEDLFDLYEFEALESGEFNFLDVIDGHLSLNQNSGIHLSSLLEAYAATMPPCVDGKGTFEILDEATVERYRISTYANHAKEVFRIALPSPQDPETIILISLTRSQDRPTVQGIGLTRFSESELQGNPTFRPFQGGRGCVRMTKEILLELAQIIRDHVGTLV